MYNHTKTPKELYAEGFALLALLQDAKRLLAQGGDPTLIAFIAALIANGISFFEDIFEAVRSVIGGYQLEQRVSDLLNEYTGELWEDFGGQNYRLL